MRVPSSCVAVKPPSAALRRNCHCSFGEAGRRRLHRGDVVVVDEVGAVAAAPLLELGRRAGEHALAAVPEDARPARQQERDVEDPRAVLVGILEAHVLVEVLGIRRGHDSDSMSAPATVAVMSAVEETTRRPLRPPRPVTACGC